MMAAVADTLHFLLVFVTCFAIQTTYLLLLMGVIMLTVGVGSRIVRRAGTWRK